MLCDFGSKPSPWTSHPARVPNKIIVTSFIRDIETHVPWNQYQLETKFCAKPPLKSHATTIAKHQIEFWFWPKLVPTAGGEQKKHQQ